MKNIIWELYQDINNPQYKLRNITKTNNNS